MNNQDARARQSRALADAPDAPQTLDTLDTPDVSNMPRTSASSGTPVARASHTPRTVSRRALVGMVSASAVSATLGAAALRASTSISGGGAGDGAVARGATSSDMAGPAVAASDVAGVTPQSPPTDDARLLGARIYNVRDFGAKGDGATLDTAAVQAAIDACHRDRGGIVLIPAGDFLSGTLELKSHVTLRLATQGRLLGSGRPQDYASGKGVPRDNGNQVLLYAANAEHVTVEGSGTIDGQGAHFYNGRGDNSGPGGGTGGNRERPHLLVFYRCTHLRLRDVFLTRSAYHCCRIVECEHVRVEGVRIYNRVNKNNDGFHFHSARHVAMSNCHVVCQDDACALFGSTQFVTVTNCVFSTRWSVFRLARGEAKNIVVSNCVIYETYGCPIKIRCSGGTRFEHIIFSNLVMRDVTGPISIGSDTNYGRKPGDTRPLPPRGIVRDVAFRGIRATVVERPLQHPDVPFELHEYPGEARTPIVLNGVGDDVIEDISLSDVQVTFAGGGTRAEADVREIPAIAGEYFQLGPLPAYGLYARNVRGLTLDQVRLETATPDVRPAVVLERVEDAAVTGLSVQGHPDAESTLRLVDSRDVLLSGTRLLTPAAVLLQVEGARSGGLTLEGGQVSKAKRRVAFARGAAADAITS